MAYPQVGFVDSVVQYPLNMCRTLPTRIEVTYQAIESDRTENVEAEIFVVVYIRRRFPVTRMSRYMGSINRTETSTSEFTILWVDVAVVIERYTFRGRLLNPCIVESRVSKSIEYFIHDTVGYRLDYRTQA